MLLKVSSVQDFHISSTVQHLPAQVHRDFLLLLDICYKLKRTPYIIRMRLVIQVIRYALKILRWETPLEKGTL